MNQKIQKRIRKTCCLLMAAVLLENMFCFADLKTEKTGPGVSGPVFAEETEIAAKKEYGPGFSSGNSTVPEDGTEIGLSEEWKYAEYSAINTGKAVFTRAKKNRKEKTVAVNAGHGTVGGSGRKTYCHPDQSPKVTGGTTGKGAIFSTAVSDGMTFTDGTREAAVTLREAQILKEMLLEAGYDVLMLREKDDVQLDNVARTVIANHAADIHIALHWDGDGLRTIKGAFYLSVPDALKTMEPVSHHWEEHEKLGDCLIAGLCEAIPGIRIFSPSGYGSMDMDLTQTSYSEIPSVDIELGNQCSDHGEEMLKKEAAGILCGVEKFFEEEKTK